MAIQKQVELLRQGTDAWNNWRVRNRKVAIDLSGADLRPTNPRGANLSGADLKGTDFRGTYLKGTDFSGAYLRGADLSFADLIEANLRGVDLSGADLSRAITGWTHFTDIDLRTVRGLETILHYAPSYISTSTLERSQGDIPEAFLRGAGLSDTFIEYVRSLCAHPIEYYTCFLSYTSKDQDIAERLYADLQSKGVRCWCAPHELKPGDYYRTKIDESIRVYDKLVLILSEHSIKSEWVEQEVERALEKEASMDTSRHVLFPIRLDDAAMTTSCKWVSTLRYLRHIGDFTGWKDHDQYQTAFARLLSDLKAVKPKKSE